MSKLIKNSQFISNFHVLGTGPSTQIKSLCNHIVKLKRIGILNVHAGFPDYSTIVEL